MAREQVLVLGAGIAGVCTALSLGKAGYRVTVVDEAADCMLRASRVNEGKIHLGHVYANDDSFRTAALMLRSATQFAPLVESWVGEPVNWGDMRSNPFTYLVAADSLLPSSRLFAHYEKLGREYGELAASGSGNYMGVHPESMWREIPIPRAVNADNVLAAVSTPEVAVDLHKFGELLRRALHSAHDVATRYRHRVESVSRTANGFRVAGFTADGRSWQHEADIVVNCLWDGRLKIDRQMDVLPQRDWVHRLKYRVLADLPAHLDDLPSLTFVLGRFGDIVTLPGTRTAYLSWYPACLQGWSTDVSVPEAWKLAGDDNAHTPEAKALALSVLQAFDPLVPGIGDSTIQSVAAGVIFSWGATDIDDSASELHARHDIGVQQQDGYFSINTGKFTSAPLFAQQLRDIL